MCCKYSASQNKGNPNYQGYIFIKGKAVIMILCSSFRAFNLLSFDTKHDMMHSCMTNQEQFKPKHVRIDLHRIMDACGYRQDWNNWYGLRHSLTGMNNFGASLFNYRPAYNRRVFLCGGRFSFFLNTPTHQKLGQRKTPPPT